MDAWIWAVIAAIVVAAAVVAGLAGAQRRRRRTLHERLGPEYERAVAEVNRRGSAERDLEARIRRRDQLDVRPLPRVERDRYATEWLQLQTQFVDQPDVTVTRADALVAHVMRHRGYPVDDFDERADLVAVDHPDVAEHYRTAHGIFVRRNQEGATTEELREAVVAYRSLFRELLADGDELARQAS